MEEIPQHNWARLHSEEFAVRKLISGCINPVGESLQMDVSKGQEGGKLAECDFLSVTVRGQVSEDGVGRAASSHTHPCQQQGQCSAVIACCIQVPNTQLSDLIHCCKGTVVKPSRSFQVE